MGRHRQTTEEVQANLRELLDWQFAARNDRTARSNHLSNSSTPQLADTAPGGWLYYAKR
jgi:hypothetical protein